MEARDSKGREGTLKHGIDWEKGGVYSGSLMMEAGVGCSVYRCSPSKKGSMVHGCYTH